MEELHKLEKTIEELNLSNNVHLQWILLELNSFLKRPKTPLGEQFEKHLISYQTDWIERHVGKAVENH